MPAGSWLVAGGVMTGCLHWEVGSQRHSRQLRGITRAPGIRPSRRWLSPRMSTRSAPLACARSASSGEGRCGSMPLAWASSSSTVLADPGPAMVASGPVSCDNADEAWWPRTGGGSGCNQLFQCAKIPFLTRPSWPKTLVVPDGFDLKLNPWAFCADHLIVAGLMSSRPEEPGGLVTAERPVAGPSQRMSKDTVARTDAGLRKRNRALGILKKSLTRRFFALIRALPSSRSTLTPP